MSFKPSITLIPSTGTGKHLYKTAKIIRCVKTGCTNRPFFHIVVTERIRHQFHECIEQVGTYDPMANMHNEKLVAFNFERIKYWIGNGALMSTVVAELMGLCGYFPIHPRTYLQAYRQRKRDAATKPNEEEKEESA